MAVFVKGDVVVVPFIFRSNLCLILPASSDFSAPTKADRLQLNPANIPHRTLELIATDQYRQGRISAAEVRRMLNLLSRWKTYSANSTITGVWSLGCRSDRGSLSITQLTAFS
jgi:hypothetical protein